MVCMVEKWLQNSVRDERQAQFYVCLPATLEAGLRASITPIRLDETLPKELPHRILFFEMMEHFMERVRQLILPFSESISPQRQPGAEEISLTSSRSPFIIALRNSCGARSSRRRPIQVGDPGGSQNRSAHVQRSSLQTLALTIDL